MNGYCSVWVNITSCLESDNDQCLSAVSHVNAIRLIRNRHNTVEPKTPSNCLVVQEFKECLSASDCIRNMIHQSMWDTRGPNREHVGLLV